MYPTKRDGQPGPNRRRRRLVLGGLAAATAGALALTGPVTAALASGSGSPVVSTSETVKVSLDSSGKLDVARLFSQIEAQGKGHVSLQDPTSTDGLRNLDGWGAPSTKDGKASYDFSVDGQEHFRTVANFTKKLPVSVHVTYKLDGTKVDPGDLAGKSGVLDVTYHVDNVTAAPTTISFPDGHGKTVTETKDIVTPYVGQLALDLPASFDQITTSDNRADQAGDGHGGRMLTWTMVLFAPIGTVSHTFGFSAHVNDLTLPSAHIQIVPVSPERHPELKFGQDGFSSGAKTGRDLTSGATKIDKNVLRLRDGAAQVLDGLGQLYAGAAQLNSGLAGDAAPGARKIADGLSTASAGADQLSSGLSGGVPKAINGARRIAGGAQDAATGASQLADGAELVAHGAGSLASGIVVLADGAGQLQTGAHQLDSGAQQLLLGFNDPSSTSDLIDGSQSLAAALGLISGGLQQLNDASTGLPAAKAGLEQLRLGLDHPVGAAGPSDPGGLLQGLQQIAAGLSNPLCNPANPADPANPCGVKQGLASLALGLNNPSCSLANPTDPANPCGLKQGLTLVAGGLSNPACDLSNPTDPTNPCGIKQGVSAVKDGLDTKALATGAGLDQLSQAAGAAYLTSGCGSLPPAPPASPMTTNCDFISAIYYGIEAPTTGLRDNTQAASDALGAVLAGVDQVSGGVSSLISGVDTASNGLAAIRTGVDELAAGSAAARDAVSGQILPGVDQLIAGLTTAVNGVALLAPGAAAANTGAGDLADGVAQAGDGAAQLADGAGQLSNGLDQVAAKIPDAVSGANRLATGANQVSAGANTLSAGLNGQLAPGATKLANALAAFTDAVSGSSRLAGGLQQLDTGAGQLAAGLDTAAGGSAQLHDGLGRARDGQQQIVDGAGQLSSKGTSKLVGAGESAATKYGEEYATMKALDAKGAAGALPYGAPKGSADNRAAYDITLAGVGHDGMGNTGRGAAAVVVLAAGAGAVTFLRRSLV
jgi:putative membrane protein